MSKPKTLRAPSSVPAASVPAVASSTTVTVAPRPLTLRDVIPTLPAGFAAPSYFAPMVSAIRAIATMPTATVQNRLAARDAYVTAMSAAMPGTPEPRGKHTGRFTGMAVFETQNAIYLACTVANVAVDCGHVVAMWRAELPHAKCDYIGRAFDREYPWSTLGEYTRGNHNGVPGIPGAVDAVIAWAKRGRKPIA